MQVVITPGDTSPLPAEIRLLNDPDEGEREKFFFMDSSFPEVHIETDEGYIGTGPAINKESTQYNMRSFLAMCIVKCWQQFKLFPLAGTPFKAFKWPKPTDAMKVEFTTIIATLNTAAPQDVRDRIDKYGCDFLADQIVNLSETLRVHRNWNSQAAVVGAAVCNFAIMLADCHHVRDPSHLQYFRLERPLAKVLTGGCYGSRDNVYVEYMSAKKIQNPDGSEHWYLDDDVFRSEGHAELVMKNFDRTTPEGTYKAPRPTKSTTADWTVKYFGCEVLHGEGKTAFSSAGSEKACMAAAQQLAFNPTGLVLHSSGDRFRIYKLRKKGHRILVTQKRGQSYVLSQVEASDPIPSVIHEFEGLPDGSKHEWGCLHVRQRGFIRAVFETIDILSYEFSNIDFPAVKQKFEEAYSKTLFEEPSYWPATQQNTPSLREIRNQDIYQYSQKSMKVLEEMTAGDGTVEGKQKELLLLEKCIADLGDDQNKAEVADLLRKLMSNREVYDL